MSNLLVSERPPAPVRDLVSLVQGLAQDHLSQAAEAAEVGFEREAEELVRAGGNELAKPLEVEKNV